MFRQLRIFEFAIGAAALVALLLGATPAKAQMEISECQEIFISGSYRLVNNLPGDGNLFGNDCLEVSADFVTIDLAGYTITGDGRGDGITDGDNRVRSVVVRNGLITNFDTGINFNDSREAVIENVQSVRHESDGIILSRDCRITDSIISRNDGRGLVVTEGYCFVRDNVASLNESAGMRIRGAGNSVIGNDINSNDSQGLIIECPSSVIGNTAVGNANQNIRFDTAGCNDIDNLTGN